MTDKKWPLYEVFLRPRNGLAHKHVGSLHAVDDEMALQNARDLYTRRLGWEGYSSHSGRRTFCTKVARKITEAGGSLKDVQALMGHESLQTTSRYIETDPEAQRRVVNLI